MLTTKRGFQIFDWYLMDCFQSSWVLTGKNASLERLVDNNKIEEVHTYFFKRDLGLTFAVTVTGYVLDIFILGY